MGVYEELGVKRLINAMGTYTAYGGSKMSAETLEDMRDAASSFVDIKKLQRSLGEKIAQMTNNEAAYISNGAACGVYLALLAAISNKLGKKPRYIKPEEFSKCEVILYVSHRSPYDFVFRQLGVKTIELGDSNHIPKTPVEDIRAAISENTVAVYYLESGWVSIGAPSLEQVKEAVEPYGIPIILDAAAMLPPVENLWSYTERGAAVAVFSGGKDLHGPQSSGLIVGQKRIIEPIYDFGFPDPGFGRMMKVGREEMVGLYSALKQFMEEDHSARRTDAEAQVALAEELLSSSPYFEARRSYPNEAGQPIPRAAVTVTDPRLDRAEVLSYLLDTEPHIISAGDRADDKVFYLNPMSMNIDEMRICCEKLLRFDKREGE